MKICVTQTTLRVALGLVLMGSGLARAEPLQVSDAWVRGTIGSQKSAAVFFVVQNAKPALLVGAQSPVAEQVELLEMEIADSGPMRPHPVASIRVAGGEPTHFTPLTHYLLLKGLKRALVEGERVPLQLNFSLPAGAQAAINVDATVKPFFVGGREAAK